MKIKHSIKIKLIYIIFSLLGSYSSVLALEFKDYPILSEHRLKLTREYCKIHYGIDFYELKDPQIIVIHYTAVSPLEKALKVFKPDNIPLNREYIKKFGEVNVGVHFVVDKSGDIYNLLPEKIIGRHTIGFNHVSLGIENVARDEKELTYKQLLMNAELVYYLVQKYPSIKYLIGHFEYINTKLPHFVLFKELVEAYKPTIKHDPDERFMSALRKLLKEKYGIILMK